MSVAKWVAVGAEGFGLIGGRGAAEGSRAGDVDGDGEGEDQERPGGDGQGEVGCGRRGGGWPRR